MSRLCPQCGDPLAESDVDLFARVALCRTCRRQVPLPEVPFASVVPVPSSVPVGKGDARTPGGLTWVETCEGSAWRIAHTPNPGVRWLVVAFAILWNSFAWRASSPLWMRLVAVPLAYLGLASLNRATLELDPGLVRLRWGPFPQIGNFAVSTPAVARFFVETRYVSSERGPVPFTYVKMETSDGRARSLFGFRTHDEAEFVAGRLAAILDQVRGGARVSESPRLTRREGR